MSASKYNSFTQDYIKSEYDKLDKYKKDDAFYNSYYMSSGDGLNVKSFSIVNESTKPVDPSQLKKLLKKRKERLTNIESSKDISHILPHPQQT